MPLKMCGSVSARFSVWFSCRRRAAKVGQVRAQHLEPLRIERGERRLAAHDVDRRLPLRPGLGEDHRAGWKVECRQANLAGNRGPGVPPAQPSRNHQVHDDEEFVREGEDDPLAHPSQAEHACGPPARTAPGAMVRTTNGLPMRSRSIGCPATRLSRASR